MKVLLVNPHTASKDTAGGYSRFLAPMPPISLAYVAAALERARIDVSVYDDYTISGEQAMLLKHIAETKPDVVGLSCVTPTAPRTYDISADVRNSFPTVKIIMGNLHSSVFYKDILNNNLADAVVHGEGEETVVELVETFGAGGDPGGVKGIAYLKDGEAVATESRQYIQDLDSLPFPAWHLFPIERYRLFNFARVKEPGTLVLGSRGCPYACNFCSLKIMGRRRRKRSAANIADEFQYLYERFGYVQPSFVDPIFPFSEEEAIAFSEEIIRRGLHKKLIWITETRVDHVNERMLKSMKAAGLSRIMYGFETGTSEGLESIEKNVTLETAVKAVEMTRRAGIQIIGFFMIGVPGDDAESVKATIRFAKSLDIDFAKFTVFSPFPGTAVYEEMMEDGRIPRKAPWQSFTNYPSRENPAVYVPDEMTNEELIRFQKKAFVSFYLRPRMLLKHLFRIRTLGFSDIVKGLQTLIRG